MSDNLTLKEKIELFKISKRPRKQIRFRFDNMELSLPAVDSSSNLTLKNFRLNKKEFKQNMERKGSHFHTIHTDNQHNDACIDITRLKNEYFRYRLFQ